MKKTAIKGMSLLFVLFVVAAFATGVQAQDAADNENTTAGYAALGAGVALGLAAIGTGMSQGCLLYTSPSPRDQRGSRMPSSA